MTQRAQKPVEVVVACHSPARPLGRAVASVLDGSGDYASVTVVAHNTPEGGLAETLRPEHRSRVRFLHLEDDIPSPAGPFSLGMARATAPWVSIMGSDDYLQPGAVRAWLRLSRGADAVMPRLLHAGGSVVRTPPARPAFRSFRSAVKDRLYYRSAPLGIIRRSLLGKPGFALAKGLATGEDLALSASLWSGGRAAVQTSGPAYVIGAGASDRVTMQLLPLNQELAHVPTVWNEGFLSPLTSAQVNALGTKYLRIHFFGAAYYRAVAHEWKPGDRRALATEVERVLGFAPHAARPLSIADRRLLDAILDLRTDDARVNELALARRRFGAPTTLVPREFSYMFDREAPVRFMAASALVH